MSKVDSGFGNDSPRWILHIANRPELDDFQHDNFRELESGEVKSVIQQTSNHWRKVFSIMAKISFSLFDTGCNSWQEYRDTKLLTADGWEAISYAPYTLSEGLETLTVICGYTYAESQLDLDSLIPHSESAKLLRVPNRPCFVTPYFDWRQLNNELLAVLIKLMSAQLASKR